MNVTVENLMSPQVLIPFALGFAGVLLIVGLLLLIRASYRKSMRRAVERLIQEKEAIKALVGGIVEGKRRGDWGGIVDLKTRAQIIVDELDVLPAPKSLIPLVEALSDIGFLVEQELSKVENEDDHEVALADLDSFDVEHLQTSLMAVEKRLDQYALLYGISEVAIYKGGLYV